MSLHQNLNNLTFLCKQVDSLNSACFYLSGEQGSAKNELQKMMFEASRVRLEEQLEITIRRIRKMLNDHYATNNSCLFNPPKNDTSTIQDGSNLTNRRP